MNDSKEFNYAKDLLRNSLNQYDFAAQEIRYRDETKCTDEDIIKLKQAILNLKNRAVDGVYGPSVESGFKGTEYYVFSMSCVKDSLSQWRAYGNGEVCLRFDLKALEKAIKDHRPNLFEVCYKAPNDTEPVFEGVMKDRIDHWINHYNEYGFVDSDIIENGWESLQEPILGSSHTGVIRPLQFKQNGFEEEKEVRLVILDHPSFPEDAKRINDTERYFTPKLEISLKNADTLREVITGITFGPGIDRERASFSLAALESRLGLSYSPEFSTIPFRT
ncbi:DUF2971 domain-containing protein [Pararoseomonas baculiformis]|uniref:DUF2971 domain-containing protein n=1 Tax=Pararoseomonas baculiformis TaxID=2820812 RepID=UPI001ADFD88E|nr:DUF2971 domain-containing protein [Pararoseomonas baculiformis]